MDLIKVGLRSAHGRWLIGDGSRLREVVLRDEDPERAVDRRFDHIVKRVGTPFGGLNSEEARGVLGTRLGEADDDDFAGSATFKRVIIRFEVPKPVSWYQAFRKSS